MIGLSLNITFAHHLLNNLPLLYIQFLESNWALSFVIFKVFMHLRKLLKFSLSLYHNPQKWLHEFSWKWAIKSKHTLIKPSTPSIHLFSTYPSWIQSVRVVSILDYIYIHGFSPLACWGTFLNYTLPYC